MAEEQAFLLYTRETGEAIRKAMRLPPAPSEESYYKPTPKQTLLNRPQAPENKEIYSGPFAFSYNATGKLVIAPGFLNRNGDLLEVEEQIVDPAAGYVCIESHLEDKGNNKKEWTKPAIVFLEKPKATAYPLGRCVEKDGALTTECYEVPMAFILATRQCPLAGD